MGITISDIQEKTLLKYAKTADVDKDGDLNEEESASLFTNLNSKFGNAEEFRQVLINRDTKISDNVVTGLGIALGAVLGIKKYRTLIDFGFLSVIGTACSYVTDKIMKHICENRVENLNSAISEFNQLKNQAIA